MKTMKIQDKYYTKSTDADIYICHSGYDISIKLSEDLTHPLLDSYIHTVKITEELIQDFGNVKNGILILDIKRDS